MMIGLVFVLSGGLGSFCWAQETAPDMNTLLKQGMDYYQSGNYEEAIRTFSDILRLSVDKNINLRAHLYLAYTFFLQGESDQSRSQLENAIRLNPQMILDDREFGPEFIKLFESAKKTVTGIAFIESVPKGAMIWIDDEEIGLTPLKRELLSGKYRIKIIKAGYSTHEGVVDIKSDIINSLLIDLTKKDNWKNFVLSTVIMGALTFLVRSI
jgi:tetratricopeptide (TPR) repeat protein